MQIIFLVGFGNGRFRPFYKLTSVGKIPGAIILTRTLVWANVVASIRLRCTKASEEFVKQHSGIIIMLKHKGKEAMVIPALEAAYEICPWVVCFKNAELLHVLMMLEVELDDGTPWPLASRGRNAIDIKNPPVTLVWNVSAQWADSDFIKCSDIERGLLRSGSPALSNRVATSRVMPALLTRS